jgi:signal transduction histidine kinase
LLHVYVVPDLGRDRELAALVDGCRAAGLGLGITHAIVHAHQGTITVHSTPADGTRFTVRLPERP